MPLGFSRSSNWHMQGRQQQTSPTIQPMIRGAASFLRSHGPSPPHALGAIERLLDTPRPHTRWLGVAASGARRMARAHGLGGGARRSGTNGARSGGAHHG